MRTTFGTILVLLGCLLAAPAVAAFGLTNEVTDEGRYLESVAPLADEPSVRRAVANQLVAALSDKVPASAQPILDSGVTRFVDSPEFRSTWVEVNRTAHPQVLAMLRGQDGSLSIEGDAVMLDLGAVVADVRQRLVAQGLPLAAQLPDVNASVQLLSQPAVAQIRPTFELMEKLSVVLPIAVVLLLAAGLAISARRGATLVVAGVGLVVFMLLLVLVQWLARGQVTARAPSPELAGAFYDALTGQVTFIAWVLCAVGGVAVIVGGFLAARSKPVASGMRRRSAR